MNSVNSVGNVVLKKQPAQEVETKQNLYRVNFKADGDSFVRRSNPAILQQQPQQDPYIRMMEKQHKEEKKKNFWNKVALFTSIGAGIAIIASLFLGRRGGMQNVGVFEIGNLEFKNLANDETIFNIRTSKSLHPKVRNFFTELLEKGKIPEDIARRAGILGEGGTNSVLMLGGSGVGKTESIKAYAKAAEADYVAIKVSDFANSFVNGTSKNISEMINALIKRAKENPKKELVISLDEVDALVKISTHDTSGEVAKNRQSLLTGIDSLLEQPNIKLFTSSNANIKDLDGAFLRRCGYNFEVPMPDAEQLREALKFQLRKCEGATENGGKFFENNSDLDGFLKELMDRKCAFGDVKNVVKAAKDKYALDMFKTENSKKEFSVSYLKDALKNIETTAGEKAAREGSFV